ncbi:hypothetical protein CFP56_042943 [Quercus suber]|uniref:Uncharacterized protein n=1 Tax=Quercus suber TaxID=58331 RepID=A0AAW0LL46_QUESU
MMQNEPINDLIQTPLLHHLESSRMLKEKVKTEEELGWNATREPRSVWYDGFNVHIPLGLNGGDGSFNAKALAEKNERDLQT